jgi:serine/threonine protein kinase
VYLLLRVEVEEVKRKREGKTIMFLGDRYQLDVQIGRGPIATVYHGHDLHMDRFVAVKILHETSNTDLNFQSIAKAATALQHTNIVPIYDYGQSNDQYFIVMEFVNSFNLRHYLRSHEVLDRDQAVSIAHTIALGLGAAHQQSIIHEDVKPQNILIGHDGSIKLTDFGIANMYKEMSVKRLTNPNLNRIPYCAPEQLQGKNGTPASDVYALGIVMYEMLTGHAPFDGDTSVAVAMQHIQDLPAPPSQINPHISPALEEIILRCLEKVPEMRFSDGAQLAHALETWDENWRVYP